MHYIRLSGHIQNKLFMFLGVFKCPEKAFEYILLVIHRTYRVVNTRYQKGSFLWIFPTPYIRARYSLPVQYFDCEIVHSSIFHKA
jgi:hypothetical protein